MPRTFVVYGTRARGDGKFTLKDLPGSGGRMDVIARSVTSAFLLSDSMRRDVEMYVYFAGTPDRRVLMHIDGRHLRNLNPDERTTGALLRHCLLRNRTGGEEWVQVSRGIRTREGDFDDILRILEGRKWYLLDMEGDDIDEAESDAVFFLGDDRGLPIETLGQLREGATTISVGPLEYHTDQCIQFLNMTLDRMEEGAGLENR